MKPSQKSGEFEEALAEFFGVSRVRAITNDLCVTPPYGCGKAIGEFRDELSVKEYQISGLCQECQDRVFGEVEE